MLSAERSPNDEPPPPAPGTRLEWTGAPVVFSQAAVAPAGTALRLVFRTPSGERALVVAGDAVLLTAAGELRRAARLAAGADALVSPEGEPVPLLGVERVEREVTIHYLATTDGPATQVDGHLLAINGVVVGDWALQLSGLVPAGETES